ncbi:MAG: hypothetical protein KDK08_10240 [Rhizobiaceae bacterium]|nr:hypothetical protein [Rhizobiaceae bacterium]
MTEEELELLVEDHKAAVRVDVPRGLLIDFAERVKLAARQSKLTVVRESRPTADEIRLAPQRANKVAGLIRHEYVDEVFSAICDRFEGERLGSVLVGEGKDEKAKPLFLSTYRFGGTLLGFASHFHRDDLPRLNKTRKALCSLNAGLLPDMFRPPEVFTENERFAVLMLQRSPSDIGAYSSVSIGIVDARGIQYVFQEELSDFLSGYGSAPSRVERRTIRLRERKKGSERQG